MAYRNYFLDHRVYVAACREPLALPPYTKMSASSVRRHRGNRTRARRSVNSCQPHDGFIVSNKAWCSRTDNGLYQHPVIRLTNVARFNVVRKVAPPYGANTVNSRLGATFRRLR